MDKNNKSVKHLMLEKLSLYSGKVMKELSNDKGFMCKCRHSHIFKFTTLSDWCSLCAEPKFQHDIIIEINSALRSLDSHFQIYRINELGIGDFICPDGHAMRIDIDDIPNECGTCNTEDCSIRHATHDTQLWDSFTRNLKITHTVLTDTEKEDTDDDDSIWDAPSETEYEETEEEDDMIYEISGIMDDDDFIVKIDNNHDENKQVETEEPGKQLVKTYLDNNLIQDSEISLFQNQFNILQKRYLIHGDENSHIEQAISYLNIYNPNEN